MSDLRSDALDRMFGAIMRLESLDECYAFFEDLCTVKEMKELSQRLEVAVLLSKGLSYQEVTRRTGVSSTTTGRVKRCLEYGSGGYRKAIAGMEDENGK